MSGLHKLKVKRDNLDPYMVHLSAVCSCGWALDKYVPNRMWKREYLDFSQSCQRHVAAETGEAP